MAWSSFIPSDLRTVTALPPLERRLLAQALVVLPILTGLLRPAGYFRLKHTLSRLVPVGAPPADPLAEATTISRLLNLAASRCPLRSTCLSQSLTLWLLLRRHGVDADICLGARRRTPHIESHAWVEYHGWPLNAAGDIRDHFAVITGPAR